MQRNYTAKWFVPGRKNLMRWKYDASWLLAGMIIASIEYYVIIYAR